MKKTIKLLTACCLALVLLVCAGGGVSAATATSVWVNGVELSNNDYLSSNSATAVSGTAATEPSTYVAWFHNGTLSLNSAEVSKGTDFTVDTKTGICGISAEGDLSIELQGQNKIQAADTDFYAAIFVHGDLGIFSENGGALTSFGAKASIYSVDGDLSISGDADISANCTCAFQDDPGVGSICSENGDILVTGLASVKTRTDDGPGGTPNATEMSAVNGNIIIRGYVSVDMDHYPFPLNSYGIYASTSGSQEQGNILISDGAYVNICGPSKGLSPAGNLTIGKNAFVKIWNANWGIYTPRSISLERCCLEMCQCSAAIRADSLFTLKDAYMAEAEYSNGTGTMQVGDDLSAISINDKGWYVYDGYYIEDLLIRPIHACEEFSDCDDWDWAQPYDCVVIENNIMGSVNKDSNYFDSTGAVTRGMVVTVMYRLAGSPALSDADYAKYNGKFSDVKKDDWYYDAVVWAYCNGVTEGMSDTSFAPQQKTSREQIVTFFWRFSDFLGYDNSGSADLGSYQDLGQVGAFAVAAFQWSVSNNIVNGTTLTTLSPKDSCTRGQMAKIITCFGLTFMDDRDWIEIIGL